jgi:hypothetical protein
LSLIPPTTRYAAILRFGRTIRNRAGQLRQPLVNHAGRAWFQRIWLTPSAFAGDDVQVREVESFAAIRYRACAGGPSFDRQPTLTCIRRQRVSTRSRPWSH